MLFSLKSPGSEEQKWEGRKVYLNCRERLEPDREDKQSNHTEQRGQQQQGGKQGHNLKPGEQTNTSEQ